MIGENTDMEYNFDIIRNIKSPQDIKAMPVEELKKAAQQMRDAILYRTSQVSGHVGPNLGDVEAMIALMYVFDAPRDKIVLDVSHQDFVYKMITGRVDGYINPADFGKVGEYTDPTESPYDLFYAGHTSPSISLCVGLAKARELRNEDHDYNIVAFIGDGALSGGEAFEGLSTAGALDRNFVVVVNDNQMAIARNHGSLYRHLTRLRETNGTAADNIFRALGFDYIYVHDGNDLQACIDAFRRAKGHPRPIVVHVNTQKGEGYVPAERDREEWHYHAPFDIPTGETKVYPPQPNYDHIIRDFIMDQAAKDPHFLVVSSATPLSFGLGQEECHKLGRQYIDVDIAEQTGVSVLAGAARGGVKAFYPVVGTFLQRAYDQLMEDWAMDPSPALMAVACSGIAGIPDETHLGFWDIPMLASIPDIVYLAPTNAQEYKAMLEWGIRQNEHKVVVRIPAYTYENADGPVDTDYSHINKFKVEKQGSRVAVIAAGDFFVKGREVLKLLADKGIDATLVNPRFVSGVDEQLIASLATDHRVVATIEDGSVEGGFGERVARVVGPTGMKCLVFGLNKQFRDHYDVKTVEKECGLLPEQITSAILSAL